MKIKNHTLILRASVFERLVPELIAGYPNERGAYLIGDLPESERDIFHLQEVWYPEMQDGTPDTWYLYHRDLVKAHAWAAQRGRVVIGFTHTHPNKTAHRWFTVQSHRDAKTQTQYHLPVSLIIGCMPDGSWSFDAWQDRHAAPLHVRLIDSKGKRFTIRQWKARTTKRSLWEKLLP